MYAAIKILKHKKTGKMKISANCAGVSTCGAVGAATWHDVTVKPCKYCV